MMPVVTSDISKFPWAPSYQITPEVNQSVLVDGFPVLTGYTWLNTSSKTTGHVSGNSLHVLADGLPVVLFQGEVMTHFVMAGTVTVLAD